MKCREALVSPVPARGQRLGLAVPGAFCLFSHLTHVHVLPETEFSSPFFGAVFSPFWPPQAPGSHCSFPLC